MPVGNVILGLLILLGPQTLYSLNTQFQRGPSLFYRASFGSLQSALRGLVASGYVTVEGVVEGGRSKKFHTITDEGVAAFHAWIRSPLAGGDLEVAALSRLFLLGLVDDADERRDILDHITSEVERELARLEEFAAALDEQARAVPEEYREVFRYQRATLDYGLMAHRAGLAWFRELAADER
ncbi:PadR family transcriptional regulator [Agromyces bracchium]|uniref:PadR family transcriptional regulator n=1 Tax=Agromyces bracchium TaxID=88376 RepID=A0A6I3M1F3_9MICO|nr:PadR family transcriptional regulator [Agromyces bracchium]